MLYFKPMDEMEYQRFLDYAITDYAEEKVTAGNYVSADAMKLSAQEYQELLPNGLDTKDHFLFMIVDEAIGEAIGFIWLMVEQTGMQRSMTIVNVLIYEAFRGRGYGTQALYLVEEKVAALGMDRVTLHAFGHNTRARSLYERLGYVTTNVHMAKKISARLLVEQH